MRKRKRITEQEALVRVCKILDRLNRNDGQDQCLNVIAAVELLYGTPLEEHEDAGLELARDAPLAPEIAPRGRDR